MKYLKFLLLIFTSFSACTERPISNSLNLQIHEARFLADFDREVFSEWDTVQVQNKNNNVTNQNLLTCLIGGDNQHYHFDNNEANKLCNKLLEIKNNQKDIELNIVTSRRTSDIVKKTLIEKLKNIAKIWIGDGKNPYVESIQKSSYFIVTSDSTSMISEAAISGKPIYVHHLTSVSYTHLTLPTNREV